MPSGSGATSSNIGTIPDGRTKGPRHDDGKVFANSLTSFRDESTYRRGPAIAESAWLRNTETDVITRHDRLDAKQILAMPGTIYEPADAPTGA